MLLLLNMTFIKVVNDQYRYLFKLLLGPLQTFWLHDASARAQKYFQVYRIFVSNIFFFLEVSVSTLNHQNLTQPLVDNKIKNF